MDRTFTWEEANANYPALSARASEYVQMDNFAVRRFPLSTTLSIEGALKAGLNGSDSSLTADPDGDGNDNFVEWAFGTDPTRAGGEVAATTLVLAQPEAGSFRFARRRLTGFTAAKLGYEYLASDDLSSWDPVSVTEESATPLAARPGYEVVTLSLSP